MSYSTIEYPVNFNESDVDSDYNTESSEEQAGQEQAPEEHQEFNMDFSFTMDCLQLLNIREDLFQGQIGDDFKELKNTMVNFCKENKVYLETLVEEEKMERQKADLEEWNPELVDGYVYIPIAPQTDVNCEERVENQGPENQACQEYEQEPEPFNEEEWAIQQANEWEIKIQENDIYRAKLFVQAKSNLNAANILSKKVSTNTQSMFYSQ